MSDQNKDGIFNPEKGLHVELSPDKMLANLVIRAGYLMGQEVTVNHVIDCLERFKIHKDTYNFSDVEAAIVRIKSLVSVSTGDTSSAEFPIAHGIEPQKGKDGNIQFVFFTSKKVVIQEDGTADFRNTDRFNHVKQGDKLATLYEGIPGKPGKNVIGEEIAPPAITRVKFAIGKNVLVQTLQNPEFPEENIKVYTAALDGVVFTTEHTVTVSQELVISGNVNLESGNVNYDGTVKVNGTIEEGSKVECSGSLIVNQNIESLDVIVQEDIQVKGGIKGRGKGVLKVKGDLNAKFIENSTVEVDGDVIIENFILNSKVFSLGNVIVSADNGNIIGSEVVAYKGVSVGGLGSQAMLDTSIEVGFHFKNDHLMIESASKIKEYESELELMTPEIHKIKQYVTRFQGKIEPAKKEQFKEIFENYQKKIKLVEEFKVKLESIKAERYNPENVKVVVRKSGFPGAVIKYRRQIEKITKSQSAFLYNFFPNQDKAIMTAWKAK